jgi:hypothetical protein
VRRFAPEIASLKSLYFGEPHESTRRVAANKFLLVGATVDSGVASDFSSVLNPAYGLAA